MAVICHMIATRSSEPVMRRILPIICAPLLLSAPAYAVSNGSDADLARTPFIAKSMAAPGR